MTARIICGQTPGGARTPLASKLPLATPYLVQVFPVYACNFRCNYCVFSLPKGERDFIAATKTLDFDLYCKGIDDLTRFPDRLRMLRFAGTGEPLLHPQIAKMIAYARRAGVADSIDIVTNGALLTPDLAQALVDAGTSRIRFSIQGLTHAKYLETTNNYAELEQIVDNIAHLHAIRGNTEVYVKIIDSALADAADEEHFYAMFSDIADAVSIEHILPATPKINYARIAGQARMESTQNGVAVAEAGVCPQPFYMMQLNPDGMVVPCCAMATAITLGNLAETSWYDIWTGPQLRAFQSQQLRGERASNPVCAQCRQFRYAMFPEDVLDNDAARLVPLYGD